MDAYLQSPDTRSSPSLALILPAGAAERSQRSDCATRLYRNRRTVEKAFGSRRKLRCELAFVEDNRRTKRAACDDFRMTHIDHLETERLLLRAFRESDIEPFAEITADEETMRF